MIALDFDANFEALTGYAPFGWQRSLYTQYFRAGDLPSSIDIPTGLGKTNVIAIWYLALKAGAALPRRLVYVVDRRAVVDQATTVADKIKKRSADSALRVSTLRGQHVDKRTWLEDPAAPSIIVGTVDMIGSRLLFSGYGVSRKMRPYHAGLLGADTLVVLDESHLVPPFERLLKQISENSDLGPKCEADRHLIPSFQLLPLSATGREKNARDFRLTEEDLEDPIVAQRLNSKKRLKRKPAGDKKLEEGLAAEAWEIAGGGKYPVRVLIYCNSRETAEKTKAEIEAISKKTKNAIEPELFVGARRVKERVKAVETLAALGFLAGSDAICEEPAFLVATSAGEVGVDLDADHLVCDLVHWERMVQRLGRVNRLGSRDSQVTLIVEPEPQPKKDEEKALAKRNKGEKLGEKDQARIDAFEARLRQWHNQQQPLTHLPKSKDGIDVSPGALRDLKLRAENEPALQKMLDAATTPPPLYPALNRPLVDAWSMTSLAEHTGRPEVQPWLRGWVNDDPQTTVIWRRYLPVRTEGGKELVHEIEDFFEAAPPHTSEKLETETWRVVDWLAQRTTKASLSNGTTVAFALEPTGRLRKRYRLADLVGGGQEKKLKDRLRQELVGAMLIVDARLGGLTTEGLLDPKSDNHPVSTADGEDGWFDPDTCNPLVPFRLQRVNVGRTEEAPVEDSDKRWQPTFSFDIERDAEDRPLVQLIVEKWRSETTDEDARSVSSRAQTLEEHQSWAATRAMELVTKLKLDGDIAKAIILAARMHDEGKQAARWQNAFRTPPNGRPYAKTANRRAPDFNLLGGYRHEFGSLIYVEKNNEFGALPDDLKDLVRHLVAAHHGRARPVIETNGCDEGPPSLLEARARDVALRFARLQKRFGPWGLAWLEAILRAADQQASRDLDEERHSNG